MNRTILHTKLYQAQKIKEKTKRAYSIVNEALNANPQYGKLLKYKQIKIEWNFKDVWYGGLAMSKKGTIILNYKTFSIPYNDRFFKDTVLHELAHIIAYQVMAYYAHEYKYKNLFLYKRKMDNLSRIINHDHSSLWRKIAKDIGGTGEACPKYKYYGWKVKWACPICYKISYLTQEQSVYVDSSWSCKNCRTKMSQESYEFYKDLENRLMEIIK